MRRALVALALVMGWATGAHAEPLKCKVAGLAPFAKGVQIFDAASGGKVVATFSGVLTPATLTEIPLGDAVERVRISTSQGSAGFRVDGWVAPKDVPLYSSRPLPVIGQSVAIADQQLLRFVGATAQGVRVEHAIAGTRNQVLATTVPCDALALGPVATTPPPEVGKPYRMKVNVSSQLDLYAEPGGPLVFSMNMMDGVTLLLWNLESKRGYFHVRSVTDVIIDAWVKPRGLEPLRPGELTDPYETPLPKGALIGLNESPQIVTLKRDVPIRVDHETEAQIIGAVEAGAEVYLIANIEGWAHVMPKALTVKAPDGGGFWVPEKDVMP